jgi:regulator of sirC expression with transglutaminase-like and TPR domain
MEDKELKALISLLDDPDHDVARIVEENLLACGASAIPKLEQTWEQTANQALQRRIEDMIHNIQFHQTKQKLRKWIDTGADELIEGAYWVDHYRYPELTFDEFSNRIDVLRKDVTDELCPYITPLEKVKVLNHVFYDVHHFILPSFRENHFSPEHSFLSYTMQSKKGNSVSLALLYAIVAQMNGLPIYGVNLPKNFILAYLNQPISTEKNVLFYINPFNKGIVLGKREIDYFVHQYNLKSQPFFYEPCSNVEIIRRLLTDLLLAYRKLNMNDNAEDIKHLLRLFM